MRFDSLIPIVDIVFPFTAGLMEVYFDRTRLVWAGPRRLRRLMQGSVRRALYRRRPVDGFLGADAAGGILGGHLLLPVRQLDPRGDRGHHSGQRRGGGGFVFCVGVAPSIRLAAIVERGVAVSRLML